MKPRLVDYLGKLRVLCAVGLIAVSLWALVLPPLFPYSTHAIVNTKVVTIKARDQGRIDRLPAAQPTLLKAGDRIATVTRDLAKIQRELQERQFTRLKLKEQLDSLDKSIAAREQRLRDAEQEMSSTRTSAGQVVEQAHKAAVEKVRLYRAGLEEKKTNEQRVAPLFADGIVTAAQWSETREQTIEAEKNLVTAEAEVIRLKSRLDGFRRGAGGGQAEDAMEGLLGRVGSYEQELSALRIQRIELSAELGEVESRIASAKTFSEVERTYDLTTPIDGVVWRRQLVNGETLMEGQSVVDMADVHSLFVEAFFRRDFMNSIAIGDRASVYLIGQSRYVEGRIADIQVQERTTKDPNIINTIAVDASMLRVTIEIAPGALAPENIGQLAKVLVSSGRGGLPERGLIWLSFILRTHR